MTASGSACRPRCPYLLLLGLGLLDLLFLHVDHVHGLLGVDARRYIVHVEAERVLLDLELVLAGRQVLQHESKTVAVAGELTVDEVELLLIALSTGGFDLE